MALLTEARRYAVASAAALVLDWMLTVALVEWFGWHYFFANAVGNLSGLLLAYGLSVAWVFERRRYPNVLAEFGLFAAVGVVGLAANSIVLVLLTDGLDIDYRYSKAAATIASFVTNFALRKWLLFR